MKGEGRESDQRERVASFQGFKTARWRNTDRKEDRHAKDVHGENGVNAAEAFLFDEGGESFVGRDEVEASLFGELVEGGAECLEGSETL